MLNRFDEAAKLLAGATTRREALLRIGGVMGAAVLSLFGFSRKAQALDYKTCLTVNCRRFQSVAVQWSCCMAGCQGNYPSALCNGTCVNLAANARNCGVCGNACNQYQTCIGGRCVQTSCPPGQTPCSGR